MSDTPRMLDQTEFNSLDDVGKWRFYRDTSELLKLRTEALEAELKEARFARAEAFICAEKTSPIDIAMTFTQSVLEGVIDPLIIKLADAYRRLYREDRNKAVIVERLFGAEQAWDESQAKIREARQEAARYRETLSAISTQLLKNFESPSFDLFESQLRMVAAKVREALKPEGREP